MGTSHGPLGSGLMTYPEKPPVRETPDGRCALRAARKSFCAVCAYRVGCWYLEREASETAAPVGAGVPAP